MNDLLGVERLDHNGNIQELLTNVAVPSGL